MFESHQVSRHYEKRCRQSRRQGKESNAPALPTKRKRRRSGYGQRSQAETGFSMIKRRQGESVSARTTANQRRELRLMVITHNVMIHLLGWVFYRALPTPFLFDPFSFLKNFSAYGS